MMSLRVSEAASSARAIPKSITRGPSWVSSTLDGLRSRTSDPTIKAIGFSFAAGVFLDAFVVRLTLVPAVMAIIGSRIWYHPRWFARYVPNPDIEGSRLEHRLAEEELAAVGTPVLDG